MGCDSAAQMMLFGDDFDPVPPPISLSDATKPEMVRAAPGVHAWVPRDAATPPPEYCLCRWSKQADGSFAPVPVAGRYVRLGAKLAGLLGFPAGDDDDKRRYCRYDTILRLGRAGFVDVIKISPGVYLLDLDSWYHHLVECIDNPDRWAEGSEDYETYLKANDLGGWKRFAR